jgi:hypothetical protein
LGDDVQEGLVELTVEGGKRRGAGNGRNGAKDRENQIRDDDWNPLLTAGQQSP